MAWYIIQASEWANRPIWVLECVHRHIVRRPGLEQVWMESSRITLEPPTDLFWFKTHTSTSSFPKTSMERSRVVVFAQGQSNPQGSDTKTFRLSIRGVDYSIDPVWDSDAYSPPDHTIQPLEANDETKLVFMPLTRFGPRGGPEAREGSEPSGDFEIPEQSELLGVSEAPEQSEALEGSELSEGSEPPEKSKSYPGTLFLIPKPIERQVYPHTNTLVYRRVGMGTLEPDYPSKVWYEKSEEVGRLVKGVWAVAMGKRDLDDIIWHRNFLLV